MFGPVLESGAELSEFVWVCVSAAVELGRRGELWGEGGGGCDV